VQGERTAQLAEALLSRRRNSCTQKKHSRKGITSSLKKSPHLALLRVGFYPKTLTAYPANFLDSYHFIFPAFFLSCSKKT